MPLVFFWAFWAALSWAFWAACLSLLTTFFSDCFLAIWAFFLSLIYLMAYSAKAFLSSGLACFNFLIDSKATPSMALSCLKTLLFFCFPWSLCLIFLWSLLQAVVHLNLWALSFLIYHDELPETKVFSSLGQEEERSTILSNIPHTLPRIDFPLTKIAKLCFDDHRLIN